MPVSFILAILCGVAGALALAVAVTTTGSNRSVSKGIGAGGLGLAVVLLLFSSAYTVPTRNVGIVTSWNKPTGEVTGPGLQWVAPWQKVDDWDASRQAFDRRGDNNCVWVRIAGLQKACVDVLVEWTTDSAQAPEQWASYKRDFGNFVGTRVDQNIVNALLDTFADHDPLANVNEETGQVMAPQTGPLAEKAQSIIEARIGGDVDVLATVIGIIRYDEKTQQSIEAFQQKVLAAKNLEQDRRNAEIQKQVSETNADVDPVVRCLELADKHAREPGFCLGGGNPVQTPAQ